MTRTGILWLYILFLVAGGLAGYYRGKSHVSLYLALGFAVALCFCAIGFFPHWLADALQALLLAVFAWRYAKTKKMMPSGMMFLVTLVVLALRHVL
jgi:uncharacterized membrane protein (UPF0136 family)